MRVYTDKRGEGAYRQVGWGACRGEGVRMPTDNRGEGDYIQEGWGA